MRRVFVTELESALLHAILPAVRAEGKVGGRGTPQELRTPVISGLPTEVLGPEVGCGFELRYSELLPKYSRLDSSDHRATGGAIRRLLQHRVDRGGTEKIMISNSGASAFTSKDRDLLRMEFMDRFGSAVSIHDGFWIKRWSTGPRKGQPKISPTLASLIDRDLVRVVEAESGMPRARFTDAGLRALIALADDRRAFQPPERYSHLLTEIAALRQAAPGD
jgi:hypothetical protein